MGFRGEQMIAILIMLASPTTPSCYIMAKKNMWTTMAYSPRERDRDDDASGGIYPDRMDLYFEDSRIDRVKVLDVF